MIEKIGRDEKSESRILMRKIRILISYFLSLSIFSIILSFYLSVGCHLYPPLNPDDIEPIVELPIDDVTYR